MLAGRDATTRAYGADPIIVAYGMGVDYAYTMVHKAPERVQHGERIGPRPAAR